MPLILLYGAGTGTPVVVDGGTPLPLHAKATDTLVHAFDTLGDPNTVYTLATLVDEDGDVLIDQNGNILVAWGANTLTALHAKGTDTLIHSSRTQ